jgi:hypothetical protein
VSLFLLHRSLCCHPPMMKRSDQKDDCDGGAS